jgi:hypothetical protein
VSSKTPEGYVVSAVSAYLERLEKQGQGIWWKVQNTRLRRNAKGKVFCQKVKGGVDKVGVPDLNGVIGGRYVALECKSAVGVQSDGQKQFEGGLVKAGGYYFVVRGVDDVIKALDSIKKEPKPLN